MTYAFVLGREPALSIAELVATLKTADPDCDPKAGLYSPAVMIAKTAKPLDVAWFNALGGTVKMAEVVAETDDVEGGAAEILKGLSKGKVDFGISFYSLGPGLRRGDERGWDDKALKILPLAVKKRLKEAGVGARVVLPTEGAALTSVQVAKNGLLRKGAEILVIGVGKKAVLARTVAVQAFESFSGRDFGRPGRDAKSGMLPPKLARLMVNLAGAPKEGVLLDPFCGSGTVLSEAALLGHRALIGTDVSEKAVQDTVRNFAWTVERAGVKAEAPKVFASDVKFLPEKLPAASVSAIVTEPFLGPPMRGDESDQKVHFIYLELMGLYRRAFEAFAKLLKPGGTVVIAFPVFGGKRVNILRDLEAIGFRAGALLPGKAAEALGLKSLVGLLYRRPDQKVGREIFRFTFKK